MTREEFLESFLLRLWYEVDRELTRRRNKGGQQAGVPRTCSWSYDSLIYLERELRHAMEASDDWIDQAQGTEWEPLPPREGRKAALAKAMEATSMLPTQAEHEALQALEEILKES